MRGISKHFPGVVANKDISLNFHAGEIHVLLGENGAGKSTLIGVLSGMQQPDAGEILIDGTPARIRSPRASLDCGIGTVFQHTLLVSSLTVIENLMLGGSWWHRLARPAALARYRELGDLLGVEIDPSALLGTLSLGQQQQVEIMRALWRGGRILILDEPTSMLAPQGVHDLGVVLRRLRSQGVAIILVTHKLAEAYELGDRISVLRRGRVVGGLAPDERCSMSEQQVTDRIIGMMFGTHHPVDTAETEMLVGHAQGRCSQRLIDRSAKPQLSVAHVSTRADGGSYPLLDVTLDLWPGEVLGIAGIDGNGQKHLAEVLAGQRAVTAGTITLAGRDVTSFDVPARRQAGIRYVTDDRVGEGTVGAFSVATNLLLKEIGNAPFWRRGIADRARIDQHARDLIQEYDIRVGSEQTPIGKLSGGNIQKVLLAREAGSNAAVIVFNKPTHGLDLHNAHLAHDRIIEGAARGHGTIVISTDLDELIEISDRIGVLYQGRLLAIVDNGPGAELTIGTLMAGRAAS